MLMLQIITSAIFALSAAIIAAVFAIIAAKKAKLWHIGTVLFALIFVFFTLDAVLLAINGVGLLL